MRIKPLSLFKAPCAIVILLLAACAGTQDIAKNLTPEEMYREGVRRLYEIANYAGAINSFQTLQARYPFGEYAIQAHLELIYAHYLAEEPEMAAEEADRFILEHPRHPSVAYAYYMKGLAYFTGIEPNWLENTFNVDPAEKYAQYARKSFQNFKTVVEKFPDSAYADDARQRMIFLRNFLARHEYYVADYYFRRGAYVSALQRAQRVINNYPTTPSVPKALAIMVESYQRMDMP
ncbi:MAG TPA: outer membrane protein assembly factor BamD, partial [Gammaproteobacteria bacterium]|nr:outer membrane protein assembly factor BamD [Gammaproteobacteria bacterium]